MVLLHTSWTDCTAIYGLTLFLELKDINNLNICLKIINKLIKESKNKNKVVLSLKKLIVVYQIGWKNNSLFTFNNFKGYNNSWLTLPD